MISLFLIGHRDSPLPRGGAVVRTCRIGDCVREKLKASLRAALEAVREGKDGLPRHVR